MTAPGTPDQAQQELEAPKESESVSRHFDAPMSLTLEDMKPFSGPRRELPPLAMPDPKGQ